MAQVKDNIRPEFQVHMLTPLGQARAKDIAVAFSDLLDRLEAQGITGRDMALVKTKLEEACFVAKRGMASLPENQE
jgi:hypothetical protein